MPIESNFPFIPTPNQVGAETSIVTSTSKTAPLDADTIILGDSADSGKKKLWTIARLKSWLGTLFAALKHNHAIADVSDLSTQLSNKAAVMHTHTAIDVGALPIAEGQILHAGGLDANDFEVGKTYATADGAETETVINRPPGTSGSAIIFTIPGTHTNPRDWCIQIWISRWLNRIYMRTKEGPTYGYKPWETTATATPPQEYDLPLAEGWTAYGPKTYCKDQFGRVHIDAEVRKGTALVAGETIATLPVGYRPNKAISTWGFSLCNSNTFVGVPITIETTGVVHITKNTQLSNISAYVPTYTITIDRSFPAA